MRLFVITSQYNLVSFGVHDFFFPSSKALQEFFGQISYPRHLLQKYNGLS